MQRRPPSKVGLLRVWMIKVPRGFMGCRCVGLLTIPEDVFRILRMSIESYEQKKSEICMCPEKDIGTRNKNLCNVKKDTSPNTITDPQKESCASQAMNGATLPSSPKNLCVIRKDLCTNISCLEYFRSKELCYLTKKCGKFRKLSSTSLKS